MGNYDHVIAEAKGWNGKLTLILDSLLMVYTLLKTEILLKKSNVETLEKRPGEQHSYKEMPDACSLVT